MGDRARLDGGPGWSTDAQTLRPVIDDLVLFREGHAEDPALEVLVALWSGRPVEAERLVRANQQAESLRWRALLADCLRDQGCVVESVAAYRSLVAEAAGTKVQAVMQQHLGKALFAAGDFEEAATCFERALHLRREGGAEHSLLYSSEVALGRAIGAARLRSRDQGEPLAGRRPCRT